MKKWYKSLQRLFLFGGARAIATRRILSSSNIIQIFWINFVYSAYCNNIPDVLYYNYTEEGMGSRKPESVRQQAIVVEKPTGF